MFFWKAKLQLFTQIMKQIWIHESIIKWNAFPPLRTPLPAPGNDHCPFHSIKKLYLFLWVMSPLLGRKAPFVQNKKIKSCQRYSWFKFLVTKSCSIPSLKFMELFPCHATSTGKKSGLCKIHKYSLSAGQTLLPSSQKWKVEKIMVMVKSWWWDW